MGWAPREMSWNKHHFLDDTLAATQNLAVGKSWLVSLNVMAYWWNCENCSEDSWDLLGIPLWQSPFLAIEKGYHLVVCSRTRFWKMQSVVKWKYLFTHSLTQSLIPCFLLCAEWGEKSLKCDPCIQWISFFFFFIQGISNPRKKMGLRQIGTQLAIIKGILGYAPQEKNHIRHWLRI